MSIFGRPTSITRSRGYGLNASRSSHPNCNSIGYQGDDGSSNHQPDAYPNPHHQRIEVNFKDGTARVLIQPLVNEIEVFLHGGAIGNHSRSLLAGLVEASFRIKRIDLLAAPEYVDDCPFAAVVRLIFLRVRTANKRVGTNRHLVAVTHLLFFICVECSSGKSNHDHDYAEVDNVAAVPPGVAMAKLNHRGKKILAGVTGYDATSADKLRSDRQGNQNREHDGHQRIEIGGVIPRTQSEGATPAFRRRHQ